MSDQKKYDQRCKTLAEGLTADQIETLSSIVEEGPFHENRIPSKDSMQALNKLGLTNEIVFTGQAGYQAATYLGRDVYMKRFGAETIQDAKRLRKNASVWKP